MSFSDFMHLVVCRLLKRRGKRKLHCYCHSSGNCAYIHHIIGLQLANSINIATQMMERLNRIEKREKKNEQEKNGNATKQFALMLYSNANSKCALHTYTSTLYAQWLHFCLQILEQHRQRVIHKFSYLYSIVCFCQFFRCFFFFFVFTRSICMAQIRNKRKRFLRAIFTYDSRTQFTSLFKAGKKTFYQVFYSHLHFVVDSIFCCPSRALCVAWVQAFINTLFL